MADDVMPMKSYQANNNNRAYYIRHGCGSLTALISHHFSLSGNVSDVDDHFRMMIKKTHHADFFKGFVSADVIAATELRET